MKCYYHHDCDAVGTCKSCGKGLCEECQVDLGKGLACKGRCEEEVQALIALIDNNLRNWPAAGEMIRRGRATSVFSGAFFLATGVGFVYWALSRSYLIAPLLPIGGLFALYGLVTLVRALKIPRPGWPEKR